MLRKGSEPPERHRPEALLLSLARLSKGTASRRRLSAGSCQSDLREGGTQAKESAADVRLDRADGTPGLTCDLRDRELAEVAQNDGLPIRLRKRGHCLLDHTIALGGENGGERIRSSRDRKRFARFVLQREKPRPTLDRSKRAIDRDPEEPAVKRALASPRPDQLVGGHKGLLRDIFRRVGITEDARAGADDGS